MAGSAALSTLETIERSQYAEGLGYDGLLIVSPWYQVHTQRKLYAHFKAVRDAVTLPIMIYNNPAVTGIHLSVDLLERMATDGIIQYVKDANPDPYNLARLKMRWATRSACSTATTATCWAAWPSGRLVGFRAPRTSIPSAGRNWCIYASTKAIMTPPANYGTKSCRLST